MPALLRLTGNVEGLVIDAVARSGMRGANRAADRRRAAMTARGAEIVGTLFGPIDWPSPTDGTPVNVSAVDRRYDQRRRGLADELVLKVLRQVEPGIHPQVEIGRYLTHRKRLRACGGARRHAGISPPRQRSRRRWPSCIALCRMKARPGNTRSMS